MKITNLLFILIFITTGQASSQEVSNVVITGKLLNKLPVTISVRIGNTDLTQLKRYSALINSDSTFTIAFYLAEAQPIKIINQTVFCVPGDSVNVIMSGNVSMTKMIFTGNNSQHYTYFQEVDDFEKIHNNKNENFELAKSLQGSYELLGYKSVIENRYHKAKQFYIDYCKRHPCSIKFKNFAFAELYYAYITRLVNGYELINETNKEISTQYFKGLTPANLQNDKYANSWEYAFSLQRLITYYWNKTEVKEDLQTTVARIFKTTNEEFKGETKDILLSKFFRYYFESGKPIYKDFIISEYLLSKKQFIDKSIYGNLIPFLNRYKMFEMELGNDNRSIIKNKLGIETTIGELIKSNKGNIIYIDFWASWCVPCRDEMPFANKLKKRYEGKSVKFIYLSKDQDENAWLKAFDELAMDQNYSYLLSSKTVEDFSKSINLTFIPRYLLLDTAGRIVDGDAHRPSDQRLILQIEELLQKN